MTIVKHEIRQNKISFLVWTIAIIFLLAICIFMYPEMESEMGDIGDVFSSMGSFTQAFGMDKVNFGSLNGFYAVECGNILGLGGAFFASLCAIGALAKEEKEHTAEFLLTHPISRKQIVAGKFIAVLIQIIVMNVLVFGAVVASVAVIGEAIPWKEFCLLHLAYLILQVELAGICFGVSAFLRKGALGIGLGIAIFMYFLNIIANISKSAEFLNYITPFGYANGANIVTEVSLDGKCIMLGVFFGVVGVVLAFVKYCKKDIG